MKKWIVLLLVLSLVGCDSVEQGTVIPSDYYGFTGTNEDILLDYFSEVTLGFEFGDSSQLIRKWRSPMIIYYEGKYSNDLEKELHQIVDELNGYFSDGFSIDFTEDKETANCIIFFGKGSTFARKYNVNSSYTNSNWGLFFVDYDQENYIYTSTVYVDTNRANKYEQMHLLREELTQSLGMARDSMVYQDSIFYSDWTDTTAFSVIDIEVIRLLYSEDIEVGWDKEDVTSHLPNIMHELFGY